jgi:hypothetical protein
MASQDSWQGLVISTWRIRMMAGGNAGWCPAI